jgi:hypothetical protein
LRDGRKHTLGVLEDPEFNEPERPRRGAGEKEERGGRVLCVGRDDVLLEASLLGLLGWFLVRYGSQSSFEGWGSWKCLSDIEKKWNI